MTVDLNDVATDAEGPATVDPAEVSATEDPAIFDPVALGPVASFGPSIINIDNSVEST